VNPWCRWAAPTTADRTALVDRVESLIVGPGGSAIRLTDAKNGELTVFTRDSGVELVDAVTASCRAGSVAAGIHQRSPQDGRRW